MLDLQGRRARYGEAFLKTYMETEFGEKYEETRRSKTTTTNTNSERRVSLSSAVHIEPYNKSAMFMNQLPLFK